MTEALRFFSQTERQLALTTTVLTERSERIVELLRQAGTEVESVYDDMSLPAQFVRNG